MEQQVDMQPFGFLSISPDTVVVDNGIIYTA